MTIPLSPAESPCFMKQFRIIQNPADAASSTFQAVEFIAGKIREES